MTPKLRPENPKSARRPYWDELADGFFGDPAATNDLDDKNGRPDPGRYRPDPSRCCRCGGIELGDGNWDLDVRPDCPVHGDLAAVEWPTFRRDDEEDPF